ncbi:MAG: S-adenosylmethionine:tRNA ribosyltransferase-isomerase [Paludibacteraceae bacterium]|nr:S-adenosylmethionine:tRNA ribosyltransferase-isomerase [Paludibacteraceae bacterium]
MEEILIEEYNYPLPDERIAKYPLANRDQSKLLIYRDGKVSEDQFYHIGEYLSADSLLIYNNTRVIQARLEFHKNTPPNPTQPQHNPTQSQGARIEVFCLEPLEPHDYQLSLGSTSGCTWKCMIGNAKKWKSGALSLPVQLPSGEKITLSAEKGEQTGNTFAVRFWWNTPASNLSPLASNLNISFAEILDAVGELPIPPYLNRKTEESDKTTYQTVYSRIKGSVAAPTAGLHFTYNVLSGLRQRGIQTAEVTLHVGAGTFQPVKVADANQHTMHTEIIAVPKTTIQTIINNLGHIVAVGTTSMRTLESLYFIGEELCAGFRTPDSEDTTLSVAQFAPYEQEHTLSTREALQALLDYLDNTQQDTLHAETQIMIRPGYRFRVVDQLITNFHQPKSTLLLLVSAFVGGDWHTIYDYALSHNFRFLSYGDSSILSRRDSAFKL